MKETGTTKGKNNYVMLIAWQRNEILRYCHARIIEIDAGELISLVISMSRKTCD